MGCVVRLVKSFCALLTGRKGGRIRVNIPIITLLLRHLLLQSTSGARQDQDKEALRVVKR